MIGFIRETVRRCLLGCLLISTISTVSAQVQQGPERPRKQRDRQPGIYFPQAPRPGQWRRSVGLLFTSTPPELTEEVRVSVPAIDLHLQRGLTKHFFLVTRLQSQLIQNQLSVGLRWARPVTQRFFVSAGYEVGGWFGALQIKDVFNSQAYGIQHYPNISAGYRLTRSLQLSTRFETILDGYYHSSVGGLAIDNRQLGLNGYAVSFVLEQPFYAQQHVMIGFRAAYSNFNWQLWSLYDTFDRNLLYPQLFFGLIW